MEIKYVKKDNLLEFKNLDIGDCFIFDNSVYMKTEDMESLETHCRQAKCIQLSTGKLCGLSEITIVKKIECILKVYS